MSACRAPDTSTRSGHSLDDATRIRRENCYDPGRCMRYPLVTLGREDRAASALTPFAKRQRGKGYAQILVQCGARCGEVGDDTFARAFFGVRASGEIRRSEFRKTH